jgi:DNA-binding MarR family transcriptional regulator
VTDWVQDLREIDPLLFHNTRLLILSLLVAIGPLTQGDLKKKCKITWGALSAHIKQLEKSLYIEQRQVITFKGPRVLVDVTPKGIKAYSETLYQLRQFIVKVEGE